MPRLNFIILTGVIVAVILHGSLYPYDFHIPHSGIGPWQALLESWARPPSSLGDALANLLLYVPFGFFATLARRRGPLRRFATVTVAGFLLCTAIELAQFYDRGRVANLSDVYLNTFGTMLGASIAVAFAGRWHGPRVQGICGQPVAILLIATMLGYHLFPYVPTIDLHKYWQSLKPVVLTPELAPYPVFYYFALWLITSRLVAVVMPRRARLAVVLFAAFVLASKIVIVSLVVTAPELLGAGLGVIGAMLLPRRGRGASLIVAVVLGALIIVERLEPFTFHATAARFGWIPFKSLMGGSLAVNIQSFFEKFFLYGSCVWICREAGLRLSHAAAMTALVLFATSYAEVYLPGRSAEITDAVMALLAAAVIAALEAWRSGSALAEPGAKTVRDARWPRPPPP
ncbi:MAG: VanZ family protein [Stellaceae bacterium]